MTPLAKNAANSVESVVQRSDTDIFADISVFCRFLWEELKPFPGRGQAVIRLVVASVSAAIVAETLRIPSPSNVAYLIFFVVSDIGAVSLRIGLLGLPAATLGVAMACGVSICFMDAPWFRLPATYILLAVAMWSSRVLVLGVAGRLVAITLALYLSAADFTSDPEELTESTLWIWSIIATSMSVAVVTSFLLEPKPELLLRAHIIEGLESVQKVLASFASGQHRSPVTAGALRRQAYLRSQSMRQLLARWKQSPRSADSLTIDWDLAISLVERMSAATATLELLSVDVASTPVRNVSLRTSEAVKQLIRAVQNRQPQMILSLDIPSIDELPNTAGKAAAANLVSALADCRLVLTPYIKGEITAPTPSGPSEKPGVFVTDAFTNPDYARFAWKVILSLIACDVFMNAVDWPGIRTCLITCVATAIATPGAQHQKQVLRLVGACVGGIMGLLAAVYLVPRMDSIVGLTLLIAVGTACCAWVGAGSPRVSYAGFQMALAFFIVLIPGFETNIDLTGIRDRFVGILLGITAMWFVFDNLWYVPSRQKVLDKLVSLLRLLASSPIAKADRPVSDYEGQVSKYRRELYSSLDSGRTLLDETTIELSLTLDPYAVKGGALRDFSNEVGLAALLVLELNERKVRLLLVNPVSPVVPEIEAADERIKLEFAVLASAFSGNENYNETASSKMYSVRDNGLVQADHYLSELDPLYQAIRASIARIAALNQTVRALPNDHQSPAKPIGTFRF